MADQSINDYQDEISVLNRLLAVQNVIHIFTSIDKIADFSASSLKLVPGVQLCSFCLHKHKKPIGDFFDASWRLAGILSHFDDYRKVDHIKLPVEKNLITLNLQTTNFFFGYVLIVLNDREKFERYRPAVYNSMNIVAINLENHVQNILIKEHEKLLEKKVKKRTIELREEIARHLHSQKALKESESLIKSISSNLTSGMIFRLIIMKDGTRKFTYLSDSVKQIYGISPEEGIADSSLLYSKVHIDDIESLIKKENEAIASLSVFRYEFRIIYPSSNIEWSSVVSLPQKVEDYSVCFDGILFNITNQKKNSEILSLQNEALAQLTLFSIKLASLSPEDNLDVIITKWLIEVSGAGWAIFLRYNHENKALTPSHLERDASLLTMDEKICDPPEKELSFKVSDELHDYIVSKTIYKYNNNSGLSLESSLISECAKTFCLADSERFIRISYVIDGKLYGVSIFEISKHLPELPIEIFEAFVNIASVSLRRLKDQKALINERSLLRSLIDLLPEPIYAKDTISRFLLANRNCAKIMGVDSPDDLIGKTDADFYEAEKANLFRIDEINVLKGNSLISKLEEGIFPCGGNRYFLTTKIPLIDNSGRIIGLVGASHDITDRMLAEEELRRSEKRWRTIVEGEPDCVKLIDRQGRFLEMNPAGLSMIQASLDQVKGRKAVDLVAEQDRPVFNEMVEAVFRGEKRHLVFDMIGLDGKRLTLETTSVPLMDSENIGNVTALVGVSRDITEQIRAEKKIAMLASAIRSISDCVDITDMSNRIIFVNEAFMKTYEYEEHELIGKNINIIQSPNTPPELLEAMNTETLGGGWQGELLNIRKDGSEFPVLLSTSIIKDDKGKPQAIIGIKNDITRRKIFEDELRQSKKRLSRGESVSKSGNWEFHLDGGFFIISEGSKIVLGLKEEKIGAFSLFKVILHEYLNNLKNSVFNLIEKDDPFDVEFKIRRRDTGEILDIHSIAEYDLKEKIIFGVIQDITVQKYAEEKIRRQSKNLSYLVEIGQIFSSTLNLEVLLQTIVERAIELSNLDTGALYLVKNNELFLAATNPKVPADLPETNWRAHIDDHPHIKKALYTGEPVVIEDANSVILTSEEVKIKQDRNLTSILYLPLIIENQYQGILILGTCGHRRIFTEDEIDLYRMFSGQAKLVIENSRLFDEIHKYNVELEQKNKDLGFLTSMAFELAELPSSENLSGYMIEKLSDYTKATIIASMDYHQDSGSMILNQIHSNNKLLNLPLKKIGRKYIYSPVLITNENYELMLNENVGIRHSLHDLTFGSIPEHISNKARIITGIECYIVITIATSSELLGALILAFKATQKLPKNDLMISVANLASITARRYGAERALKLSENKQKAMIANISDVITIIDKSGLIMYESPNIERLLGWKPEDLTGKKLSDYFHADDVEPMAKLFRKVKKSNGSSLVAECRYRAKNGRYIWVRNAASNLLNNPAIKGILLNYHDITERKSSEDTLHKFRLGIERSPDAIFITGTDGIITYANPAFTSIYGYKFEEVKGLTPRIIKSGLYSPEVYVTYWQTLISKKPVEGEIINKKKDGSFVTIEGVNSSILDNDGNIIGFLAIHRDVSKRKESEEELKSSEERFRKAFITSPDSLLINRLSDGMYISTNNGFSMLTGFTSDETIGKTFSEINIWEDMSDLKKMVYRVIKEGFVSNLEAKLRMKDGSIRTGLLSASIIDFKGVEHILTIIRDIEEIKLTQDALKESEERFKQVAETAGEWIWEVDKDGLYTYSSPAVEKVLGYLPEEIIGKLHFYDLFSPETRESLKNEAFKVFEMKEKFFHFQNKNLRKDGKIIILETTGTPITDNDGNLLGYRGTDSDVTERLQFIENLHKLSVAVEQSPASIIITNLKGDIEYVNPRFTQITGYPIEEVIGKNPRILKSGQIENEVYKDLWMKISNGNEWRGEFYNRKKNGEFFWEAASISPIKDGNGKTTHYLGVKEDITEKKEATRRIFDTIIETEERERLRYSHELHDGLGPILSTINLYFQMLTENTETDNKDAIISRATNCINEAIQTIKEISYNLSPSVLSNFGIVSGINNFITRVNETQKLDIDFDTNIDYRFEKNIEITIYRIITELINNTLKYACASHAEVSLIYYDKDQFLTLKYMDNGCGFELEEVLSARKGLGLSNIFKRVNTLNGKIEIETGSGKGIKVNIELKVNK